MKIGLIGNMNNNNFALMRYFRDLGADAHLLLYANDGQGSLSNFRAECEAGKSKCGGRIFIRQPYLTHLSPHLIYLTPG